VRVAALEGQVHWRQGLPVLEVQTSHRGRGDRAMRHEPLFQVGQQVQTKYGHPLPFEVVSVMWDEQAEGWDYRLCPLWPPREGESLRMHGLPEGCLLPMLGACSTCGSTTCGSTCDGG
jgi:hypothetical protein